MNGLPRIASDVLIGVFAVTVLGGAVVVVQRSASPSSTPSPVAVLKAAPVASTSPTASSTPKPPVVGPAPSASGVAVGTVVLAGPDLAKVKDEVATLTGRRVEVVDGAAEDVLAPSALDGVTGTPKVVVLEVLAGSNTTARATTAISAVRKKWPGMQVVVVGPFSSDDRKSAAAVKTAAQSTRATFLDPVLLKWRTADTTAELTAADLKVVAEKLAALLA